MTALPRLLLLLATAAGCAAPAPREAPASSPGVTAAPVHDDFAHALARADAAVQRRSEEAASHRSWKREAALAAAYITRADLRGSIDDYLAAERHLAESFALSRGGGPHLLRARLSLRLHRVAQAQRDLDALSRYAALSPEDEHTRAALLGDVALQQGRVAEAGQIFERLLAQQRDPADLARLASQRALLGRDDEADALLLEALASTTDAQTGAWLELQRGLLALGRGALDQAQARYDAADQRFGGWWHVDEHRAELDARQGRIDRARERYLDVIARTDDPEFMDALAELLAQREPEAAAQWHARARAGWRERLARLPEAAYGHALSHFLHADDGAAQALQLAQANLALRPGPEAELQLALAQAKAGARDEARSAITRLLQQEAPGAAVHGAAAVLFASDRPEFAAQQAAIAAARDPAIGSELAWLRQALDAGA